MNALGGFLKPHTAFADAEVAVPSGSIKLKYHPLMRVALICYITFVLWCIKLPFLNAAAAFSAELIQCGAPVPSCFSMQERPSLSLLGQLTLQVSPIQIPPLDMQGGLPALQISHPESAFKYAGTPILRSPHTWTCNGPWVVVFLILAYLHHAKLTLQDYSLQYKHLCYRIICGNLFL